MAHIKIEISADTGIAILSFLREFVKADGEHDRELQFISECVQEFEVAVINAISPEVLEDAIENIRIQALLGNSPPMRG